MSQEVILGIAITVTLVVVVATKVVVQRILRMKMDESAIMHQLEAGPGSSEALALATGIAESRVAVICEKNPAIQPVAPGSNLWRRIETSAR